MRQGAEAPIARESELRESESVVSHEFVVAELACDAHLLAWTLVSPDTQLCTANKRLENIAHELGGD